MANITEVRFKQGTYQEYVDVEIKDRSTFYYTTDTHDLYLGSVKLTGSGSGSITKQAILDALGYTPADSEDIPSQLAQLADDATHRLVTDIEKSSWTSKGDYSKPDGGIPASDLSSAVQSSLSKADTALQSYTESDPVYAASPAAGIQSSDIDNWNSKTSNIGTITEIIMNGQSKGVSGAIDLGAVLTTKPSYTASEVGALSTSEKGAANGVASLGDDGKVPESQLPSYVDDVLEYATKQAFPVTGESGKIYVDLSTNLTWRWSGSAYVEISPSIALGETSSTAYPGDKGKATADGLNTHTTNTTIHVTSDEKSGWSSKYDKPEGGIPSSDLSSDVQTSLGKADTAVQDADYVHTDNNFTDADKNAIDNIQTVSVTQSLKSGRVIGSIDIDGVSTNFFSLVPTTYQFTKGTNGFTVTPSDGTGQFIEVTPHMTSDFYIATTPGSGINQPTTNSNTYLGMRLKGSVVGSHKITGTGIASVSSDSNGALSIDANIPINPSSTTGLNMWIVS